RIARRADGTFEILCLKYVDPAGAASGGLFHALVEFALPEELLAQVEKGLKKDVPAARIAGPGPLLEAAKAGARDAGSVTGGPAVLTDKEKGGFAQSVVTSGHAPLMPGSKAVVAAILNPQGATLLWNSLTGSTSDVSVAIRASYEASVQSYNARVTA